MKKVLFILMFLFSVNCFAALSPFYQSKKEIETILADKRLSDSLGSAELIYEVLRTAEGYTITSTKYSLKIDVKYLPSDMIGPAKFELTFHEKERLDNDGFCTN